MRSRYSAYAIGGLGEYLLNTWHPAMNSDLSIEELSHKTHEWIKLEILNKTQKGDEGSVEFKAYYVDDKGSKNTLHENSYFQRVAGKWLYVGAVQ